MSNLNRPNTRSKSHFEYNS